MLEKYLSIPVKDIERDKLRGFFKYAIGLLDEVVFLL